MHIEVKYGPVTMRIKDLDLSIRVRRKLKIFNYLDTAKNEAHKQGMGSTEVTGTFMVYSEAEKRRLEEYAYNDSRERLYVGERFYKDVLMAEESEFTLVDREGKVYEAALTFIALDPVPYNIYTEEALY